MNGKPIERIGKKFHRLLVLAETGKRWKGRTKIYLCRCDCGIEKELPSHQLKPNGTKSCGCLLREVRANSGGQNNHYWRGFGEISAKHWNQVVRSARKRDIVVGVTIQQVWDLFLAQDRKCALTGLPIFFAVNARGRNGSASLDRIDSSVGYIASNIQWVHQDINQMKQDFSQDEFIKYCRLISEKNK